jgi:hypothetical protein
MSTTDHDLLTEVRADVKYMKERFENSFGRVEALERGLNDSVTKSGLVKLVSWLGGLATVGLSVIGAFHHSR